MTLTSLLLALYLALLGLLSLHGLHRLALSLLYLRHRRDRIEPVGEAPTEPVVTVQLPLFNEPAVVERIIDAACALDWPAGRLQIQVLDDSTDETTALAAARVAAWRARGVEIALRRREDRRGFKAGALAEALPEARGELLALFDADFLPPPDFLRRAIPHLGPGVGMVQARWGHINEDESLLTRLAALLLDGHFVVEHTARHRAGRFFNFNGTAGIWRRAAIEEAGGWQADTLTEDLDLSYRAQLAGWRFVYLRELVVPAELPGQLSAFRRQQRRWARGSVQTARKLLPGLLRSRLPLGVKIEATAHLLGNLAWPLTLALAVLMPLLLPLRLEGPWPPASLSLLALLLSLAGFGLFYGLALGDARPGALLGRLWRIPLAMALGLGLCVSQSRAVVEGLGRPVGVFERTPKRGDGKREAPRGGGEGLGLVELGLGAWCAVGLVRAGLAEQWAALPGLMLFAVGLLGVGLGGRWGGPSDRTETVHQPLPEL